MDSILHSLLTRCDIRLCSVHLVDSFYCTQPAVFVSAVLLSASTMLRLTLPHVNVLTKVDLIPSYGKLPFNMDFFTGSAHSSDSSSFLQSFTISTLWHNTLIRMSMI